MTTLLQPKVLRSWNDLQEEYRQNNGRWDGWLFRGQTFPNEMDNSIPAVKTSLELAMERFNVPLKKAATLEYQLLRDFKRSCHLVSPYTPATDHTMEWLALFRHFGGPSRLSDWTYSFWIAVFFAVERARVGKDICEIWAVDARKWQKRAKRRFSRLTNALKRYGSNSREEGVALFKTKRPGLWTMNSFRLNDRLSIQQGAFFVPLDVTKPFMENFCAIAPKQIDAKQLSIFRIALNADNLKECIKQLYCMNLTRSTMYPGLAGLARSLENTIAMPHLFYDVKGTLATSRV